MKTLYITNNYLKGGSGAIYASKAFVNCFAAVSDSMTLIYPTKSGCDATDINSKVELVPVADRRSKIRKLVDLLFGKMHRYGTETTRYFDATKYDVAVFDTSVVSYRLIKKAKKAGLKCVCIHHNYQIEFVKDDTKWYLMPITLLWTYFSEKEAVCNSDLNLTLTQNDIESLSKHYDQTGKYDVIGVCDFVEKTYIGEETKETSSLNFVITGQLSSIQTEQSLIPWINEYYPILKDTFTNSSLVVAGRNPSAAVIKACEDNGITIIPSPEEMKPILDEANYFICPTNLGSGLKLRNMDGLRAGLQVLTHERSARGYEKIIDSKVMYSYVDKESFKLQLARMVLTPKSKQEVLDAYKSYFSLDAGINRLRIILTKNKILS